MAVRGKVAHRSGGTLTNALLLLLAIRRVAHILSIRKGKEARDELRNRANDAKDDNENKDGAN